MTLFNVPYVCGMFFFVCLFSLAGLEDVSSWGQVSHIRDWSQNYFVAKDNLELLSSALQACTSTPDLCTVSFELRAICLHSRN